MPAAAPAPPAAGAVTADVSVVVVSHDGARWLPAVLDGIAEQTRAPARVLAVDTGSRDGSADLLEERLGPGSVLREDGRTHYPAAVDRALRHLRESGAGGEWVWLLHDDARPAPDALEALLRVAAARPDADLLGPKLREWPSLRRLLELGVTISGTGRRETGLERGEYDQGQHDEVRDVLAVNTAGLLVRRAVLEELGGLDERLPIFGNDVDLGWRAAAAGHLTVVVPQAVVFHAEAAHRGVRRTPLTGRHTHYQERRAALYTLLVNCRSAALPFQLVRLVLGTLVRMVGFLLVRSAGEALDDLAALVSVYGRPGEVLAGRRDRRRAATGRPDRRRVRSLLAPAWLPYRHGLDVVGDLVSAATLQAADVAERRRAAAAERDPAPPRRPTHSAATADEDDDLLAEPGLVARLLTDPVVVVLAAVVVVLLAATRLGLGDVSGGALSPAPGSAGDWWSLHTATWHPQGVGSEVPAPAYVLPLALLATVLGPGLALSLLLVLSAPVALWGAYRFLRVAGRLAARDGAPRWALVVGATSWAVVPLASGAWGDGRLGVVVGSAVLPWLAHASLGFADPDTDRRWRAAWRTGLLATLLVAVLPTAWVVLAAVALVVLVIGAALARSALRERHVAGPPATAVATVAVLLLPWWVPAVVEGTWSTALLDVGRLPATAPDGLDLLVGRLTDLGVPGWWGAVLPVLALLALVPRGPRVPVLVCWLVAVVTAVVGLGLSLASTDLPSGPEPVGLAAVLVVLAGCFVTAAVLGATALPRGSVVAAGVLVVAALAPLAALVWAVAVADTALTTDEDDDVPAYMTQQALTAEQDGVLVVRGTVADGFAYDLRRGAGVTLGEDEVLAATPEDDELTGLLTTMASEPSPDAVDGLARAGVRYLVMPAPADGEVAARLDATGGLTQASAETRETRAWELGPQAPASAVADPTSLWTRVWRTALLVGQGVALVVVLVLALPTIRRARS